MTSFTFIFLFAFCSAPLPAAWKIVNILNLFILKGFEVNAKIASPFSINLVERVIDSFFVNYIFCRDLSLHYGAFLQRKIGKVETGWKESRYISVLFDAVTSAFIVE